MERGHLASEHLFSATQTTIMTNKKFMFTVEVDRSFKFCPPRTLKSTLKICWFKLSLTNDEVNIERFNQLSPNFLQPSAHLTRLKISFTSINPADQLSFDTGD